MALIGAYLINLVWSSRLTLLPKSDLARSRLIVIVLSFGGRFLVALLLLIRAFNSMGFLAFWRWEWLYQISISYSSLITGRHLLPLLDSIFCWIHINKSILVRCCLLFIWFVEFLFAHLFKLYQLIGLDFLIWLQNFLIFLRFWTQLIRACLVLIRKSQVTFSRQNGHFWGIYSLVAFRVDINAESTEWKASFGIQVSWSTCLVILGRLLRGGWTTSVSIPRTFNVFGCLFLQFIRFILLWRYLLRRGGTIWARLICRLRKTFLCACSTFCFNWTRLILLRLSVGPIF